MFARAGSLSAHLSSAALPGSARFFTQFDAYFHLLRQSLQNFFSLLGLFFISFSPVSVFEEYLSGLFGYFLKRLFEAGDDFRRFGAPRGPGARHQRGGVGFF